MSKTWYIDKDTTDAYLDAPVARYPGGTFEDRMRAEGLDPTDIGTLAAQTRAQQRERGEPELPRVPKPGSY